MGRQGQWPEQPEGYHPSLERSGKDEAQRRSAQARNEMKGAEDWGYRLRSRREALTAPGAKPLSVLEGALRGLPVRRGSGRHGTWLKRGEGFPQRPKQVSNLLGGKQAAELAWSDQKQAGGFNGVAWTQSEHYINRLRILRRTRTGQSALPPAVAGSALLRTVRVCPS